MNLQRWQIVQNGNVILTILAYNKVDAARSARAQGIIPGTFVVRRLVT